MAHNSRIRPNLAAWAIGTAVVPAEWEAFDLAQFESINGDQGGVWAPASVIEIGGSGMKIPGPLQLGGAAAAPSAGDINVGTGKVDWQSTKMKGTIVVEASDVLSIGATSASAVIEVDGIAGSKLQLGTGSAFQVDINADTNVKTGATLTLDSGSIFVSNSSSAQFAQGVTLNPGSGSVSIESPQISGSLGSVLAGATLTIAASGILTISGTGNTPSGGLLQNGGGTWNMNAGGFEQYAFTTKTTDIDETIFSKLTTYFRIPSGTLTATRDLALDIATVPPTGVMVWIFNDDANPVNVLNGVGGSNIGSVATGKFHIYRYNGAAWEQFWDLP